MPKEKLIIVKIDESKCTGCGLCVDACPSGAISVDDVAEVDEVLCVGCRACIRECPNEAIYAEARNAGTSLEAAQPLLSRMNAASDGPIRYRPPFAGRPTGLQPAQPRGLLNQVIDLFAGFARFGDLQGMGRSGGRGCGQGQGQGRGQGRGRGAGKGRRRF